MKTFCEYIWNSTNRYGGNGHTCKDGEYIDFCCGKIYQNSEIFKGHMNSLQLQIYQDDFEVCNPIGSKRTIHKVCGVYFTIRNWPNNSRLNHVYPIALCNTDDLKSESTDFNNIWRLVVDEIKVLESVGINISKTLNLRGSISNICADNAGANTCLGFAEGFNAVHSCRICELPKSACQTTCNEQLSELRTIEKYEGSLQMLAECTKVNYAQTKGIRMSCDLNKLNSFHVVQNYCIDIMHDLNEGVVPFLMKLIFNHCIEKKIFTRSTIITKSQYFDYGKINKKNIPSQLNLEKDNLNQNASQSICLFRHLPFILYEYENQLKDIWDCFTSLQTILQIVHSRKITEKDLITLRVAVTDHLQNIQEHFRIRLLPKHHNLTHYETVIRAIGPLICHTTIRYEAKHQQFKQIAKANKNFKDLTATLAWKHQKKMAQSMKKFTHIQKISSSCKKSFAGDLPEMYNNESMYEIKFLMIDDKRYEKGLLILHDNTLHEILLVLESNLGYFLSCKKYKFVEFNSFLHSFKIQEDLPNVFSFIEFKNFEICELYEKKLIGNDCFVISDSLEMHYSIESTAP